MYVQAIIISLNEVSPYYIFSMHQNALVQSIIQVMKKFV